MAKYIPDSRFAVGDKVLLHRVVVAGDGAQGREDRRHARGGRGVQLARLEQLDHEPQVHRRLGGV